MTIQPPWDLITLTRSTAGLNTIRQALSYWIEFHTAELASDGEVPNDDTQIRRPAYYPTHGTLRAWIEELDEAIERIAKDEGAVPTRGNMPEPLNLSSHHNGLPPDAE